MVSIIPLLVRIILKVLRATKLVLFVLLETPLFVVRSFDLFWLNIVYLKVEILSMGDRHICWFAFGEPEPPGPVRRDAVLDDWYESRRFVLLKWDEGLRDVPLSGLCGCCDVLV